MRIDLHIVTAPGEPADLEELYYNVPVASKMLQGAVLLADRVIFNGEEIKNRQRPFRERPRRDEH